MIAEGYSNNDSDKTKSLEMRKVTKRFGSLVAVNAVSLDIREREIFSFLGPSGCGKTTLLRCVAGLEDVDEGEILIGGEVVNLIPPYKRNCSIVFQQHALFPHMSVFNNIAFGLKIKKLPKREIARQVNQILKDVRLDGYAERYPQELSGGQQQRVAIARMLINRPSIFLMDEPLSNLDARLRLEMRSELKELHRNSQATTVYVTHDRKKP